MSDNETQQEPEPTNDEDPCLSRFAVCMKCTFVDLDRGEYRCGNPSHERIPLPNPVTGVIKYYPKQNECLRGTNPLDYPSVEDQRYPLCKVFNSRGRCKKFKLNPLAAAIVQPNRMVEAPAPKLYNPSALAPVPLDSPPEPPKPSQSPEKDYY